MIDALHVAVMERHSIRTIMTFDAGFAGIEAVELDSVMQSRD